MPLTRQHQNRINRDRQTKSANEARQNASASYPGSNRNRVTSSLKSAQGKALRIANDAEQSARNLDSKYGISSNHNKHSYSNPTASGSGGQTDREWKNHKWLSRERNSNGKWVYDYGDRAGTASSSGKTKQPSSNAQPIKTEAINKSVDKAISDGKKFIANVSSQTSLSSLLKKAR